MKKNMTIENATTNINSLQILLNVFFSLFGFVLSLLFGLIIKRLKSLETKQEKIENRYNSLSVELPSKYVQKEEYRDVLNRIFNKLDRIEEKIDRKADKE